MLYKNIFKNILKLSLLVSIFGLSITSCGRQRPNPNDPDINNPNGNTNVENEDNVSVKIINKISEAKVGDYLIFNCEITGTDDKKVYWEILSGDKYISILDSTLGTFYAYSAGTVKLKAYSAKYPNKMDIMSFDIVDSNAIATIESITKTASDQFAETTVQGTLVSLYQDGDAYSGLIYDGTAVMPLYKFASVTQAENLKLGNLIKLKGIPSRYKEYYWAEFNGSTSNIVEWKVTQEYSGITLPEAEKWTGADASAYAEIDSSDFKHVVCDVIAVKIENSTYFKIVGSSDTDRLLGLQYTPSDAAYCVEGTKSRMEFVTGDLKNSEIIKVYPINIELKGLSLTAEKTVINVGSTTTLSLSDGGNPVTENITWTSSDDTIATVEAGVVTGVKEGTVTISATYGENTATINIKVLPAVIDYTSEATAKTITEANADGLDSSELYIVEGVISKVNNAYNGQFYMTTDGAEAEGDASLYVYNSCFGQEALSNDGTKWLYSSKKGYSRTDFYTVGQKVKILCFRADYNGIKEVKGVILTDDPYWLARKATVYQILDSELDATKLYLTEAYVTSIEKVSYGRFHASANDDGTGTDLYIYSSGFYNNDPTVLSQKDDSTWNYDFNKATAPSETTLTVGDKVTLVVYRADYISIKEVKGVIYNIETGELKTPEEVPDGYTSIVNYDFTSSEAGINLDAAATKTYLNSVSNEIGDKLISEVATANYIYQGNLDGGPGVISCLKFGRSITPGELKFSTVSKVGIVKLTYFTWSVTRPTTINVNEKVEAQTSLDFITPIETYFYLNEPTNEISIKTEGSEERRIYFLSMSLYTVSD